MRSLLLTLLVLASPASAAERSYSVTWFDKVRLDGPYRVTLTTGRSPGASASGVPAALDAVSIEVQGTTLVIRARSGADAGPVTIHVSGDAVRSARVNGAGALAIDRVRGLSAELLVAGSGSIDAPRIEVDKLSLLVSGTGRIAAAGRALGANLALQGSGLIDAAPLAVDDARIASDGSGVIRLTAKRTAKVAAAGVGLIEVGGGAKCEVDARGSVMVDCPR